MTRLVLAALTAAVLLVGVGAAAAAGAPTPTPTLAIGPNQAFVGLVNGSTSKAVVRMSCFGPSTLVGQLGHPLPGQTVEVLPSPAVTIGGFTGQARQIEADAIFVSPLASAAIPRIALFDFYGVPAPIPTSLLAPCWGSGRVLFTPVAGGPAARPSVVAVMFQGQP
jgi:hypothetical protein